MNRYLLVVLLGLLVFLPMWAENYHARELNGKYGYQNSSGRWVIPAQYDLAFDFRNSLGEVVILGQHGLIDSTGTIVVPCIWDECNTVAYSATKLVIVDKNGLKGIYSPNKAMITSCQWDSIDLHSFSNGWIRVQQADKFGVINTSGNTILPCLFEPSISLNQWGNFEVSKAGKKGLHNASGKELIPCRYQAINGHADEQNNYIVTTGDKKGLLNAIGTETTPCQYDSIGYNTKIKGYLVMKYAGKQRMYGLLAADGDEIIPCSFDSLCPSDFGYSCRINNVVFYFDQQGNPLVDTPGIELSGSWSYNANFNTSQVKVTGYGIKNVSSLNSTGNMKLQLFLTNTVYAGGKITGYVIFDKSLSSLLPGKSYTGLDYTQDAACIPPVGSYYVTLCLLEDHGNGYEIQSYMNFDGLTQFQFKSKLEIAAQVLQNLSNALNSINGSLPTYTPQPVYNPIQTNTHQPQGQGHMVQVTCSLCHGTGYSSVKEYPPTFGLDRTIMDHPCEVCGDRVSHSHKVCPLCRGLKYEKKWVP